MAEEKNDHFNSTNTSDASEPEVRSRFVKTSEENIIAIKDGRFDEKTDLSTRWGVRILKDWLSENDIDIDYSSITPTELDKLLARFYVEVRKVDGSFYSKPSYICLRAAIKRYIQSSPFNRPFCIFNDAEFFNSNQVLKGMFKKLPENGMSKVTRLKGIDKEDMDKLIETGVIGTHNPRSLQNLVWLSIAFQFGMRGRDHFRSMTKETFERGTDPAGSHFYEYAEYEYQKKLPGEYSVTIHRQQGRMYEREGDPLCPVSAMDKYLSLLHPELDCLWQTPYHRFNPNESLWYIKSPLGINTLAKMMKNMSKAAGLSRIYTNHCTRGTVSKTLIDANFDRTDIINITGHKDTRSLDPYFGNASSNKKKALSKTLSDLTSQQDNNISNTTIVQNQKKEPSIFHNWGKSLIVPDVDDSEDFDSDSEDQSLTPNPPKRKSPEFSSKRELKKQKCFALIPDSDPDSDIELNDDDPDDPDYAPHELRLKAPATKHKEDGEIEGYYKETCREKEIETTILPGDSPEKCVKNRNENIHNLHRKTPTSRSWKTEDIHLQPLPQSNSNLSDITSVQIPFVYFNNLFTMELINHIVFQTNLFAKQQKSNTAFSTDKDEFLVFLGVLIYMSICSLPSIDDYWATETRVPQVADKMSSNRFKLLRHYLHFNDDKNANESNDAFYKVRPIFYSITNQFLQVSATSVQCIDYITVPFSGTRPGNQRECAHCNHRMPGFKLFCRSSEDGFIHDIVLHQGEKTFSCHPTKLSAEESEMSINSKAAIALVKSLKNPMSNVIYSSDYFTSIELVEYLRHEYKCRYTGTAKSHKIGNPPLKSDTEMEKESTPRGSYDFTSSDGILALKWKDEQTFTIISTDAGVLPISTLSVKANMVVPGPHVVKNYYERKDLVKKIADLANEHITPMGGNEKYINIFRYALDLCIFNAWLQYKRDCHLLEKNPISQKEFRLSISHYARNTSLKVKHSGEEEHFSEVEVKKDDLFETIYMVKQEPYDNDSVDNFDDIEVKKENIHEFIQQEIHKYCEKYFNND